MDEKKWIEKANYLNAMISKDMSLTELRFFCLYLSKINARDVSTRDVKIPLSDFEKIFGVTLHTTHLRNAIRKIMSRTVVVYDDDNEDILTLYSRFRYKRDNVRFIEVSCNDKILPYLFDLKKNYTSYMLKNIIKLNSVAKIRFYEVMKQYEKLGGIRLELGVLQKMISVSVTEFRNFRQTQLEPIIKDINEYTDIVVSYEKNLSCRKVVALTFTIQNKKDLATIVENDSKSTGDAVQSLYYKCDEAYTIKQLTTLMDYIDNSGIKLNVSTDRYIYSVYANIKVEDNKINNLFKYTWAIVKKQINDYIFAPNLKNSEKNDDEPTKSNYNVSSLSDWLYTTESLSIEEVREDIETQVELPQETSNEITEILEIPHSYVDSNTSIQDTSFNEFPVIKFKFFYDEIEKSFVSFSSCCRLQALLEKKYNKDNTFWLLEEPFTQEQIISLIFERHKIIIEPVERLSFNQEVYGV